MKIVVDTNVLISGVFFGGKPREILDAIIDGRVIACVTDAIVDEYNEVVEEMISRKQGHLNKDILAPLIGLMEMTAAESEVAVCRDPDDDKFIGCAKDAKAIYSQW